MARLPILMYHRISSDECPVPQRAADEKLYAISLPEFTWQLDSMASMGLRGVSVGEACAAARRKEGIPGNWVVLTFDDGNRSDAVHALPLLDKRGFSATFFVGASRIGIEGGLEEGMIVHLVSSGMEIGSHGMSHRFLPTLSEAEEAEECARSRQILAEITGREIHYFSLPGGRYKPRTIQLLQRLGYRAACSSNFGYNSSLQQFLLKRIPVHQGTSKQIFRAIMTRSIAKLLPGYGRAMTAALLRQLLGEKAYSKVRALRLRG
ncbi:MAG: polysaccharide deacetylase family protein [Candidatus Latescibacterota bacterium]